MSPGSTTAENVELCLDAVRRGKHVVSVFSQYAPAATDGEWESMREEGAREQGVPAVVTGSDEQQSAGAAYVGPGAGRTAGADGEEPALARTVSLSVPSGDCLTQDDAGRIYRNHNESVLHVDLIPTPYFARNPSLLRTRGSHERLFDPDGDVNAVWPARTTPGTNRAYQHGVLRTDGTLAAFSAACAPTAATS